MKEEINALETVKSEIERIKQKYHNKAEKERTKVNDVCVIINGEKCYTEQDIFSWYEGDGITMREYDKYLAKLKKAQEKAGQKDYLTKSERVCQILDNAVMNYTIEIMDLRKKEEQEQKRQERWEIAQNQGCSYTEWLELEDISRQSEEHEKRMSI